MISASRLADRNSFHKKSAMNQIQFQAKGEQPSQKSAPLRRNLLLLISPISKF